jgi:hypothetical protein
MAKVQLKVYLEQELRDKFYDFVKAKYESLHGGLSVEVQNALAHWMGEQGLAAHTQTRINPGMPRIQEKIDRVIVWLREKGYTNQFTLNDWEKAVIATLGGDPRTVAKYLQLGRKIGKIKPYSGNVWEIV